MEKFNDKNIKGFIKAISTETQYSFKDVEYIILNLLENYNLLKLKKTYKDKDIYELIYIYEVNKFKNAVNKSKMEQIKNTIF